jgi:uncharacterized protein (TIGR02246 family)
MNSAQLATDPMSVALEVFDRLEKAWNDADGTAFGRAYAADASFVNIRGEHIVGSEAIGAGHDGIFHSIYAGSVNKMEVVRAEELAEGVVLAISRNTLECPTGPLAGRHQALSTNVVARAEDGTWQVLSSHNTLVTA